MMKQPVFTGCATAIITPFSTDGIDYPALKKLIEFQISSGVDGIVVCGTTGEASTMNHAERMKTIETVVSQVNGRVPVIAGSGSNCTETAIMLSRDAELMGVDALLLVTPYYNKATQTGLIRHYTSIADHVSSPIILYNVPSRTGVSCTAETYAALSKHANIVGVKEASGSLALIQKTQEICPDDFYIWSGNDDETASIMLHGGAGVISVVSNVLPRQMTSLAHACLDGDFRTAGSLQLKLRAMADILFREINPIPVKTALSMMGYCEPRLRLPLCEMTPTNRDDLEIVLRMYSLI